jgi:hypothetical protein
MRRIVFTAILVLFGTSMLFSQSKDAIADVKQQGSYLQILDAKGKKISELPIRPNMEYLGTGTDFFVVKVGSYFTTYDAKSKKIADLAIRPGMVFRSAAGNGFTVKNGSYVQTYDKNCKKTGERSGS